MPSYAKFDQWQTPSGIPFNAVLQTTMVCKTDTFSASPNGFYIPITGLSLTIQPESTTSKIYIMSTINYDSTRSNSGGGFGIFRNGSLIESAVGNASGVRYRVFGDFGATANADQSGMSRNILFLDSPATTSALTYEIRFYQDSNAFTTFINRARSDRDETDDGRFASTLMLMEIAA